MSTSGSSNHKQLLYKMSLKSPSSSGKKSDLFVDFNIWREHVKLKFLNASRYLILFYSLIFLLTGSCFTFNMFTVLMVGLCMCVYMCIHVCSCGGWADRGRGGLQSNGE